MAIGWAEMRIEVAHRNSGYALFACLRVHTLPLIQNQKHCGEINFKTIILYFYPKKKKTIILYVKILGIILEHIFKNYFPLVYNKIL